VINYLRAQGYRAPKDMTKGENGFNEYMIFGKKKILGVVE